MNIKSITERIPKGQETTNFSPEVHVLAGTLVPIVSTNTWWFGGKRCCMNLVHTIRHRKNLPTSEVTQ